MIKLIYPPTVTEVIEYANELMNVYECKDKALYHLSCMKLLLDKNSINGINNIALIDRTIEVIKNWKPTELK